MIAGIGQGTLLRLGRSLDRLFYKSYTKVKTRGLTSSQSSKPMLLRSGYQLILGRGSTVNNKNKYYFQIPVSVRP